MARSTSSSLTVALNGLTLALEMEANSVSPYSVPSVGTFIRR